jgi:hypothetical protein
VAPRLKTSEALLTALAGLTAYEAGMYGEVLEQAAEAPGLTYAGALAVAAELKAEVTRLGGDADALIHGIYCRASAPAFP